MSEDITDCQVELRFVRQERLHQTTTQRTVVEKKEKKTRELDTPLTANTCTYNSSQKTQLVFKKLTNSCCERNLICFDNDDLYEAALQIDVFLFLSFLHKSLSCSSIFCAQATKTHETVKKIFNWALLKIAQRKWDVKKWYSCGGRKAMYTTPKSHSWRHHACSIYLLVVTVRTA